MAEYVDARGLSCPQPVILTRSALDKAGSGEVVNLMYMGTVQIEAA
jgi:TusA-related sulfurtransferase